MNGNRVIGYILLEFKMLPLKNHVETRAHPGFGMDAKITFVRSHDLLR